jgi:signal transduction histidine kinase
VSHVDQIPGASSAKRPDAAPRARRRRVRAASERRRAGSLTARLSRALARPSSLDLAGLVAGWLAAAIGTLVLIGWLTGVTRLESLASDRVTMKANAAVSVLLLALATTIRPLQGRRRRLAAATAGLAAALALLTLLEDAARLDLHIDQLLFHEAANTVQTASPGRMSANFALGIALLALAHLLEPRRRLEPAAELLALAGGLIGLLGLIGQLSRTPSLTGFGSATHISLPGGLALLLLSASLLLAGDTRLARLLVAPGPGGVLARRLLPAALAVPLLIGGLLAWGLARGLIGASLEDWLLISTIIVITCVLTVWTASSLERLEVRRVEAEEKIRQMNAELEQRVADRTSKLTVANRELEAFSYSVSHDLRAPLRAIDGFGKALLEDYGELLDKTACGYLERMRAASRRMGQLIDDLLKLSRLSRSELRRAQVDISAQARAIEEELRDAEPGREVELVVQEGLQACGDPELLRVALTNLIANGWKFTGGREHARVEVGGESSAGEHVFWVRDNGVGFDPAYVDRLFTPFQRLHSPRDFPGSGIGLATVSRIVRLHGGRVWADARPGEGATFFFTLQRRKDDE